ncbi:hypothetical protein MVEN_01176600 [Mycena venus]|uniref:Uncharacterized protein n=1 Tax=Mycena venus TaxID=2733690 RepID=A0A8H7CVS0_9AGAR|nr:hypothetical protein MVEN_01176600 [Mycena venus]
MCCCILWARRPIVVLHSQQLLEYTLQDVASWQLPRFSARPMLVPDMLHASLGPRVETGSSDFSSVSVCSVPTTSDPLGSCTILVPGPPIVALDLGGWSLGAKNALTSVEITAILPHLTLPHLHTLLIETGDIEPATLGAFLSRHPKILSLAYEPSEILHRRSAALISPPIAHPGLTKISVTAWMEHFVSLLDAVAPSPLLSETLFPYNRDSASSVVALRSILRRIVARAESNFSLRIDGAYGRCLHGSLFYRRSDVWTSSI